MKYIIFFLIGIIALSGCKKILTEEPKSSAAEVFYNTAPEVETAVNAIYAPLRDPNALSGLYPAQLETYGDYVYGRGSYLPLNAYQTLDNTNITRAGQMWDQFYRAIRNANLVIANAPNGSSISAGDVDKYVAEAKFLRAFTYFTMVRNWGGLPLRTEANMTVQDVKRSSKEEIYNLIVSDLLEAETKLPDVSSLPGRPSRWSAKSVLTEVYLHQAKYADAMQKSNEVITSGKYALVPVTTSADFDKIFGPDVVTTSEEIFYLKFSRQGTGQGWQYVMFAHHPGAGYHGAGGFYAHYSDTVTNPVIANWNRADLRRVFNIYNYDIGLGKTSVLFRKFKDPAASTQTSAGNDYPFYRFADMLLFYAEAASRVNNGPTALAVERLNMVHRRAYGQVPTQPSAIDFKLADYNATTFLDEVIKERGYETAYEAKRWLDLKRLGIAKTKILQVKGVTVADKFLLWPIPLSEMNYNKALDPVADQNPGY
jgi:starch-binding outer membrane protein, SusD/RagB family